MVPIFWRPSKQKQLRSKHGQRRRSFQPAVEALENRWVPTGVIIRETAIPTANAFPYGIVFGPDNNVWFTESQKGKIGVINLAGTIIHEYPIPSIGGFPSEIIVGPDKNLWFSEQNAGIGTITVGGAVSEYALPSATAVPRGLTVGPDGNIWVAESNVHKLARVTTAGVVTEYALPSGHNPSGITLGPDNHLWYTLGQFDGGGVGQFTLNADNSVTTKEYYFKDPFGNPLDALRIAPGPDGAIWFTAFQSNRICRITTDGVTKNSFLLPNAQSEPFSIVPNTDGTLWFTEYNGNRIGQIFQDATFKEYNVPTANSFPLGIATDVNKNLWFTENSGDKIGEAILPPTHLGVTTPGSSTAGTPFTITVSALNDAGGVAAGYTGFVHFTSSDNQATLPPDFQFTPADFSTHTFLNQTTLRTAGNQTITATDTAATVAPGTGSVLVSPATATGLGANFGASGVTAGAFVSYTVTALDPFGNTATSYRGTVHFTSNDPQASLPADYLFVPGDNGRHMFFVVLRTAGMAESITVTDTSTGSMTATASIKVTPAALDHLAIGVPAPVIAGNAFTPTVSAVDAFGNTINSYQGTITFSSNDSMATLPGNYMFVPADNGSHQFPNGMTLRTAGNITLNVQDVNTPSLTGTQSVFVNPGAPSKIKVVPNPNTVIAGKTFTITVTIQDAFANTVTGYQGTVFFKTSDSNGTPPGAYTYIPTDNGAHVFSAILRTSGAQTITVTDSTSSTVTGTGTINITPASFDHLVLTAPPTATAGSAFSVTVTTADAFGNQTTGYVGTIKFTSTDPAATLPANFTLVNGNSGSHLFANGVTLKTAGNRTITIKDTNVAFYNAQAAVTVNPAAASHLGINAPATATAGTSFDVTVTALDPFNNTSASYTGTVQFTSTDTKATLPSNYTFMTGDNGQHLFSGGVTLRRSGSQTLTVKDVGAGTVSGTATITVNAAATGTFLLAGFPSPAAAGTTGNFTVTATDSFGNTTPAYTGTVHFTSSDKQASLPTKDYTFVAGDAGVHPFIATLKTSGNQTLTATDTVATSITGSAVITINPGAMTGILLSGFPSPVIVSTPGNFTVASVDAFGNTTPGYTGTIQFSSSDTAASLPGPYTFLLSDQGQHTFTATLNTLNTQSLTATDTTTPSLTSTENNIAVNNPVPTTTGLSVASAPEGSAALTITVIGTNFINTSTVKLNGSPIATTFLSSTQLQTTIPAANLADETSLSLTVSNPGPGGGISAAQTFTVTDAALSASASSPTLIEGTTFNGVIATFTDANPGSTASDFTATIDWGDGNHSNGIVAAGSGGFTVKGSNTYSEEGAFTVTVAITDVGSATTSITSVANVADAALTGTGVAVDEHELVTQSRVLLATFTDAGGNQPVTNFTATINWGDNTAATPGTVSQLGTLYRVEGTHSYSSGGPFSVSVVVQDDGGAATSATTTIQISAASLFISGNYHDLLGRSPDAAGFDSFKQVLDNGKGLAMRPIAQTVVTSTEARNNLVNGLYVSLVGRPGTGNEIVSGVVQLQKGGTPEQIIATITGGPEYFQKSGSSNSAWLDQVYRDLLGRSRNGEGAGFLAQLAQGLPRSLVASELMSSPEYRSRLIANAYLTYLGRPAGTNDLGVWLPVLGGPAAGPGGASPREQLLIGILSSTEFFKIAGNTNQSWANSLYSKFLGRPADQAGFNAFVTQLNNADSASANAIALAIDTSAEYRTRLITGYYIKLLGRTPSPTDLAGWLSALASGVTDEQAMATFVTSPEYFQRQGNTNAKYVDQLYLDLLGRPRQPGETSFVDGLNHGTITNAQIVAIMLNSDEYRHNLIGAYFTNFLGRAASGDETNFWVQKLQAGSTDEQFAAALIGTPEYINRPHLYP